MIREEDAHSSQSASRERPSDRYENSSERTRQSGDEEVGINEPKVFTADMRASASDDSKYKDPKTFKKATKWLITMLVCQGSICVTVTSSIYTAAYEGIMQEFGVSQIVAILGLSLFVFGLGLGPMLLAPLSEFYGRRPIYIGAFFFFTVWSIPCAQGQNIETVIIGRFFQGFSGSAFLSVAGGTVGDLFEGKGLGLPMMVYSASPFIGPSLGPLLGSFMTARVDWRWVMWICMIYGGVNFLIFCTVPETYAPVLRRRAGLEDIPKHSVARTVAYSCLRPFQLLFFEYMVLVLCLYSAILLGILYLFFEAFPLIFHNSHHISEQNSGLAFLGLLCGMLVGAASQPLFQRWHQHLIAKNGGKDAIENRLLPCMPGGVFTFVGLVWFAFTVRGNISIFVPIVASAFFGIGVTLLYSGIFTYQVAAYPLYAASSLAANSFARSTFAGVFPLFGPSMYSRLGNTWASAILALLTLIMLPAPFVFFKYGPLIRSHSRYAKGGSANAG